MECINCRKEITGRGKTNKCRPCSLIGRKYSQESRKKMSISHKGRRLSPSTEFKKGITPWNRGKKLLYQVGDKNPSKRLEVRHRISLALKGRVFSEEWVKNLSLSLKGRTPSYGMLGKKHPEEWKIKKSESLKGPKSHFWKGGITPFRQQIRISFEYQNWRKSIFERDNYICQLCGIHSRMLNVDHYPKTFSQILSENKIDTLDKAMLCDELWNMENGRTLCVECHKKTPTYLKNYLILNK